MGAYMVSWNVCIAFAGLLSNIREGYYIVHGKFVRLRTKYWLKSSGWTSLRHQRLL